jgi:hypothetical protein
MVRVSVISQACRAAPAECGVTTNCRAPGIAQQRAVGQAREGAFAGPLRVKLAAGDCRAAHGTGVRAGW